LIENADISKIMRRGMQILEKFVEIQKNEKVDDFFTKNGF
jgi:hypothetical protein